MLLLCCYKSKRLDKWELRMARKKRLDPKAARKHKSLTVHMNEYEYTRLRQGAESAERGLLDFVRLALRRAIKEEIGD